MTVEINKDSYWHILSEWHPSNRLHFFHSFFHLRCANFSRLEGEWISITSVSSTRHQTDTLKCMTIQRVAQQTFSCNCNQPVRYKRLDSTRSPTTWRHFEKTWIVLCLTSNPETAVTKQGLLFAQPPVKKVNAFLLFFSPQTRKIIMWRVGGEWTSLI